MSFLDDFFATEKNYTATFTSRTPVYSGAVITSYTEATAGTAMCLLWNTAMSKTTVSEKYKDITEAVAVFNYSDITFTIPETGYVTINSKKFAIIVADNIADQNEIIQVLLKKYES